MEIIEQNKIFLTVKELASRWRKKKSSIYDLATRERIPHTRVGKSYLFDLQQIEEFEAANSFHPRKAKI